VHAPIGRTQEPNLNWDDEGVIAVKSQVRKPTAVEQLTPKSTDSARGLECTGGDAPGIRSLRDEDHEGNRGHRPAQ